MRTRTRLNISLIVLALALATLAHFASGQNAPMKRGNAPAAGFMRLKMVYTQNILEGLTLENYDLIITNGVKMWGMGNSNLWQLTLVKDYRDMSDTYREHVLAMVDAARGKNIEAAREAYGKTLRSCYDCHRNLG